jgi:hypothetical protein
MKLVKPKKKNRIKLGKPRKKKWLKQGKQENDSNEIYSFWKDSKLKMKYNLLFGAKKHVWAKCLKNIKTICNF